LILKVLGTGRKQILSYYVKHMYCRRGKEENLLLRHPRQPLVNIMFACFVQLGCCIQHSYAGHTSHFWSRVQVNVFLSRKLGSCRRQERLRVAKGKDASDLW